MNKSKRLIVVLTLIVSFIIMLLIFDNKLTVAIVFTLNLASFALGRKYNFYEKMDEQSQKFFKWYVIIGSTITVVCLILLALYVHNKTV